MKTFSFGWFIAVTIIHLAVTALVGLATLGSVLGASPTHNPANALRFSEAFFWIWDTGPIIASKYFGITFEKGLVVIVLAWSALWGAVAGVVFGKAKRNFA